MRMTGTVVWFNPDRGYGFIRPASGKKDCFVHYSAIGGSRNTTLAEGELVEFDVVQAESGPAADNVTKLSS
jgi:CspA family cold shock protein